MLICRLRQCEAVLLPELDQQDSILWLIAGGFHLSLLWPESSNKCSKTKPRSVMLRIFTFFDLSEPIHSQKKRLPVNKLLPVPLFLSVNTYAQHRHQRICTYVHNETQQSINVIHNTAGHAVSVQ